MYLPFTLCILAAVTVTSEGISVIEQLKGEKMETIKSNCTGEISERVSSILLSFGSFPASMEELRYMTCVFLHDLVLLTWHEDGITINRHDSVTSEDSLDSTVKKCLPTNLEYGIVNKFGDGTLDSLLVMYDCIKSEILKREDKSGAEDMVPGPIIKVCAEEGKMKIDDAEHLLKSGLFPAKENEQCLHHCLLRRMGYYTLSKKIEWGRLPTSEAEKKKFVVDDCQYLNDDNKFRNECDQAAHIFHALYFAERKGNHKSLDEELKRDAVTKCFQEHDVNDEMLGDVSMKRYRLYPAVPEDVDMYVCVQLRLGIINMDGDFNEDYINLRNKVLHDTGDTSSESFYGIEDECKEYLKTKEERLKKGTRSGGLDKEAAVKGLVCLLAVEDSWSKTAAERHEYRMSIIQQYIKDKLNLDNDTMEGLLRYGFQPVTEAEKMVPGFFYRLTSYLPFSSEWKSGHPNHDLMPGLYRGKKDTLERLEKIIAGCKSINAPAREQLHDAWTHELYHEFATKFMQCVYASRHQVSDSGDIEMKSVKRSSFVKERWNLLIKLCSGGNIGEEHGKKLIFWRMLAINREEQSFFRCFMERGHFLEVGNEVIVERTGKEPFVSHFHQDIADLYLGGAEGKFLAIHHLCQGDLWLLKQDPTSYAPLFFVCTFVELPSTVEEMRAVMSEQRSDRLKELISLCAKENHIEKEISLPELSSIDLQDDKNKIFINCILKRDGSFSPEAPFSVHAELLAYYHEIELEPTLPDEQNPTSLELRPIDRSAAFFSTVFSKTLERGEKTTVHVL